MLDDIESQHTVIDRQRRRQTLREIGFDELSIGPIQPVERATRNVKPGNPETCGFEHLKICAPATARLENAGRRANLQRLEQRQYDIRSRSPPWMASNDIRQLDENLFVHILLRRAL